MILAFIDTETLKEARKELGKKIMGDPEGIDQNTVELYQRIDKIIKLREGKTELLSSPGMSVSDLDVAYWKDEALWQDPLDEKLEL